MEVILCKSGTGFPCTAARRSDPALLPAVACTNISVRDVSALRRRQGYCRWRTIQDHAFSDSTATMGKRLTQIATRTGDDGSTGLGDNTRVPKHHLRIAALGDVDELNSHIGLLLCEPLPGSVRELSIPGFTLLQESAVLQLDQALQEHNAQLPRLQEFILPAGTRAAAQAHVCRTVARRAERAVVALGNEEALRDEPRQYLNRLSDLTFVLARVLNRMDGGDDVYWKSERLAKAQE